MLEAQRFLLDYGREGLVSQFGIRTCEHPELPLCIYNYSQIDSPKTHPIVRECRALVLHSESHELVARSFPRFFNWGEVADEMSLFDFGDCHIQTKEDGSLVLIYHFDGSWRINTRGSFAQDNLPYRSQSWEQGVLSALGVDSLGELDKHLESGVTYVCEFCSPWNKVVRMYAAPLVYFLTAFDGERELGVDECDSLCPAIMLRPSVHEHDGIDSVRSHIAEVSESDATFEGVVMRDRHNHRWKVKSAKYLGLHQLRGEGLDAWNPKHMLPFILSGDTDELLTYFPEAKMVCDEYSEAVESAYANLESVWRDSQGIESQKDFALAIVNRTPYASLLFSLRKQHGTEQPLDALRLLWSESADAILKNTIKPKLRVVA